MGMLEVWFRFRTSIVWFIFRFFLIACIFQFLIASSNSFTVWHQLSCPVCDKAADWAPWEPYDPGTTRRTVLEYRTARYACKRTVLTSSCCQKHTSGSCMTSRWLKWFWSHYPLSHYFCTVLTCVLSAVIVACAPGDVKAGDVEGHAYSKEGNSLRSSVSMQSTLLDIHIYIYILTPLSLEFS